MLMMNEWMDEWMDGLLDGLLDGVLDGLLDGLLDGFRNSKEELLCHELRSTILLFVGVLQIIIVLL